MVKKLCPVGCNQPYYVLVCREFYYSGLNKCVFKQNYFTSMVKRMCVRVSPRSLRQSIMGRVGPGTCRRGGRRGGEELMQGGAGKEMGGYGSPIKTLRKPAVGHLRTCHFQGAKLFK